MKTGILVFISINICLVGLQAQPSNSSNRLEEWEKVRVGVHSDSSQNLVDEIAVKSTSFFINEDSNKYRVLQKAIVKIKKEAVSMGGDFVEINQQEIVPIDDNFSGNGITVYPLVSQKTLFRPGSYSSTEFQLLLSGQNGAKGTPLYSDIKGKLAKSNADAVWAYYIQPYYRPYGYYGEGSAYRFPRIIDWSNSKTAVASTGSELMYAQRTDLNNVLDSDQGYKCLLTAKIYKSKPRSNNIQDFTAVIDKVDETFAIASKWKVTRSGHIQQLPFDAQTFSIDDYKTENGDIYVYVDLQRDPVRKFKVDSYDNEKMLFSYRHGHAIYYLLALKH